MKSMKPPSPDTLFQSPQTRHKIGKITSFEVIDGEVVVQGSIFNKEENLMDELLSALQKDNSQLVYEIATKILVNSNNQIKLIESNIFERYAPCRIIAAKADAFHKKSFVGIIEYYGKVYYFG